MATTQEMLDILAALPEATPAAVIAALQEHGYPRTVSDPAACGPWTRAFLAPIAQAAKAGDASLADLIRQARDAYEDADAVAGGTYDTRYGHLSRGRCWGRLGRGDNVTWAARDGGTLTLPCAGQWVVYSHDGFRREERKTIVVHDGQSWRRSRPLADAASE